MRRIRREDFILILAAHLNYQSEVRSGMRTVLEPPRIVQLLVSQELSEKETSDEEEVLESDADPSGARSSSRRLPRMLSDELPL
jgi:hypothetical protein